MALCTDDPTYEGLVSRQYRNLLTSTVTPSGTDHTEPSGEFKNRVTHELVNNYNSSIASEYKGFVWVGAYLVAVLVR